MTTIKVCLSQSIMMKRHWPGTYWHQMTLAPARFGQDASSPGQGCPWTVSWTSQVQSRLVWCVFARAQGCSTSAQYLCQHCKENWNTSVNGESWHFSPVFVFELYCFDRCVLTDSKEQVECCSGISIIWIHTLGFCVCVLYVCIYGFPALGVRTGMYAWLLKSQRVILQLQRVTTITKCTHAWVRTHHCDRCPDQGCTACSSVSVHLGKTVHLYTGDTPVTSLVHQCVTINYNAVYLTSSSTSMLQLSVFTRFLFIRSRIRPGVAMITCTGTQCALHQDVRFRLNNNRWQGWGLLHAAWVGGWNMKNFCATITDYTVSHLGFLRNISFMATL